jgi:hypothetical protein
VPEMASEMSNELLAKVSEPSISASCVPIDSAVRGLDFGG